MSKQIPLSRGLYTKVDDEDFDLLNQWKWTAHVNEKTGRIAAYRKIGQGRHKVGQNKWMYRVIMNVTENKEVDHINGDALDNRRSNLRIVSHAENLRNRRVFKNNTSGYKGVVFNPQNRKWKVTINLGTYDSAEEAARAYDEAIRKLFGSLAKVNID